MTTTPTDEQLEAFARRDIRQVIENNCLDAALQSEILYDGFRSHLNDLDEDEGIAAMEQLIIRYSAIVCRIRDEHFPAS